MQQQLVKCSVSFRPGWRALRSRHQLSRFSKACCFCKVSTLPYIKYFTSRQLLLSFPFYSVLFSPGGLHMPSRLDWTTPSKLQTSSRTMGLHINCISSSFDVFLLLLKHPFACLPCYLLSLFYNTQTIVPITDMRRVLICPFVV
jgi:hypothetical protein